MNGNILKQIVEKIENLSDDTAKMMFKEIESDLIFQAMTYMFTVKDVLKLDEKAQRDLLNYIYINFLFSYLYSVSYSEDIKGTLISQIGMTLSPALREYILRKGILDEKQIAILEYLKEKYDIVSKTNYNKIEFKKIILSKMNRPSASTSVSYF